MQGAFSEKGERSRKILVVEDDEILAAEIELLLQRVGCSVVAKASCFEEALSMALESKPDLILMDIFLKGERDGVEAAQAILRKTSLPIVYMTAATDSEENRLRIAPCPALESMPFPCFRPRRRKSARADGANYN